MVFLVGKENRRCTAVIIGVVVAGEQAGAQAKGHQKPTVEIFVEEDTIVLKKYQPACLFCGEAKNVTPYMGRNICANCRAAIAEQMKQNG